MYLWIVVAVCICAALLIQYLCSAKILRMRQSISIRNMALRDVRAEEERLNEQETELRSSETSLTQGIRRMRTDIKSLAPRLRERKIEVPEPDFPLSDLEDDEVPVDGV